MLFITVVGKDATPPERLLQFEQEQSLYDEIIRHGLAVVEPERQQDLVVECPQEESI